MNRSNKLSVQTKLTLSLGAVVAVLATLVTLAYVGLARLAESERSRNFSAMRGSDMVPLSNST